MTQGRFVKSTISFSCATSVSLALSIQAWSSYKSSAAAARKPLVQH